ncbi:hypothetical protein CCY99_07500 [Helicobacter sp. 16-1353]|uniref:sulfurtransferase TusA family protein n=1 Tax=Helicobacter sp. 16-1353 TaxID=2004996 RepID=UPI000DCCE00E|nr:sulfurtransferase TusA family protein [Helicobacter sp. 16-1353]RAX52482.1 hypothetical protein CCY99_07500 [Helicobacter sp. 16-1353]
MKLDVRGLNCPEPVLRLKEVMDKGEKNIEIICDCGSAEENIHRFALSNDFRVAKAKNSDNSITYTLEK